MRDFYVRKLYSLKVMVFNRSRISWAAKQISWELRLHNYHAIRHQFVLESVCLQRLSPRILSWKCKMSVAKTNNTLNAFRLKVAFISCSSYASFRGRGDCVGRHCVTASVQAGSGVGWVRERGVVPSGRLVCSWCFTVNCIKAYTVVPGQLSQVIHPGRQNEYQPTVM